MNKHEKPDNIIAFDGQPKNTYENDLGIESLTQVQEQLDAQNDSYQDAIKELKSGNLKNIELIKETRKILLKLRVIATGLSTGSVEDVAVVKAVNERIAELDETMKEADAKKSKFA
jgi:hypothetical protein